MASEDSSGLDDRTEEATPERRDEFRERGQIPVSKDLSSVFVLVACVIAFSAGSGQLLGRLQRLFIAHFQSIQSTRQGHGDIMLVLSDSWISMLKIIIPICSVTLAASAAITLMQTKANWSWERLSPDFSRLNLFSGLKRLISVDALVELVKSIAKLTVVGIVAYLVLKAEWTKVPELMGYPIKSSWSYWGKIIRLLFWSVAGLLLIIAGGDYLWNLLSLERQMRMTKQEVKEEFKHREVNPQVKAKLKRMARDIATRKVLDKTKRATVLITNPTHYSLAIRFDPGDRAPVLLTKGVDFLALKMREVARDEKIPIIENRPLARELYATVNEGEEIPYKFWRAVAEIIKYVYRVKGRPLPKGKAKRSSTRGEKSPPPQSL